MDTYQMRERIRYMIPYRVRSWYWKVVEFFSQCEKISPGANYPILKNPGKAVAKAQEYYEKYLT